MGLVLKLPWAATGFCSLGLGFKVSLRPLGSGLRVVSRLRLGLKPCSPNPETPKSASLAIYIPKPLFFCGSFPKPSVQSSRAYWYISTLTQSPQRPLVGAEVQQDLVERVIFIREAMVACADPSGRRSLENSTAKLKAQGLAPKVSVRFVV